MLVVDSRNRFVVDSGIKIVLLLFCFIDTSFEQEKLLTFGKSVDIPWASAVEARLNNFLLLYVNSMVFGIHQQLL